MIDFDKIQQEAKNIGNSAKQFEKMFDSIGSILNQGKKEMAKNPELNMKYKNEILKAEKSLKEQREKLNSELEKFKNL